LNSSNFSLSLSRLLITTLFVVLDIHSKSTTVVRVATKPKKILIEKNNLMKSTKAWLFFLKATNNMFDDMFYTVISVRG
jgi:hypothetical protein